jgi:glycosyltransferase involved in cell wall biosynthesis
MPTPGLSIITCCKGRLEHLKHTLPTLVCQRESEVIVVDYDCPDQTQDWVAAHFSTVRVVKVSQAPIFNLSRARNIGAGIAHAPWLAFCDADNPLGPSFASGVLVRMVPGTYLRTFRSTPSGPTKRSTPLVCEAAVFQAVGGYDDALRGWGSEDRELVYRLKQYGLRELTDPPVFVETLPHSNALRSTYYEHKTDVSAVINQQYWAIKRSYFETRHRWLTDSQRYSTYRAVEQAVLASLAEADGDATFDIQIAGSNPPWITRLTARDIRNLHRTKPAMDERRQRLWGFGPHSS